MSRSNYRTVAASQTDASLGDAAAAGDRLDAITIVPASLSPGAVSVKDGAGSSIVVFAGGTNSIQTLHSFTVPLGWTSRAGAWTMTTGANVSAIAAGDFS